MWSFVEIVDQGQESSVNGRNVYFLRAKFTDGSNVICITTYFYDNPPTLAQRIARRDKILEELNTVTVRDFLEEYGDELRERIEKALANGRTRQEIITYLKNKLNDLLN